jgi:DNA polymerase III delta subunit
MTTPSLFSTSKVTVLKNFKLEGRNKVADELGQFLAGGVPPGQFVILLPDKVDKRLKVVKSIAKQGEMIEFTRLGDDGLRNWVVERFAQEGKSASRDVAEALIDLKGYDLRTLDSEIAKAVTYVGESPAVTPGDIEVLVGRSRTEQAFELIGSVLARNVGDALEILKDLLDANQSPISMIYRLSSAARGLIIMKLFCTEEGVKWSPNSSFGQFRGAVLPKYAEWVEARGIDRGDALLRANPYFTYSRFKEGAGLKLEALIDLMDRLLEANAQLVSTSVNAAVVLERVIVGVGR